MKYIALFSTNETTYSKIFDDCTSKDEALERVRELVNSSHFGFFECDDGYFVRFDAVEALRVHRMEVDW